MKKTMLLIAINFGLIVSISAQYLYPSTKIADSSSTYWGVTLKDPYRWLENLKDPEVESWFHSQANFTDSILDKIPGQDSILKDIQSWNTSAPGGSWNIKIAGGKYFYYKADPAENSANIYSRDLNNPTETLVFDSKLYAKLKKYVVSYSLNYDGSMLLLFMAEQGNEIGDLRIFDVKTKKMLPDVLPHAMNGEFVKMPENKILYFQVKNYDVHDQQNSINPKTMLHTVGVDVQKDKTILSNEKYPELIDSIGNVEINTFAGSPYIFAEKATASNYKEEYYAGVNELEADHINWKLFCKTEDEIWNLWVDGKDIYYLTSKGNEFFNVFRTSSPVVSFAKAQLIFKGTQDWRISFYFGDPEIYKARDYLILNLTRNDVQTKNVTYNFKTGKTNTINIPATGNFTLIPFSETYNECRATNSGWTISNTYYKYDLKNNQFSKGPFFVDYKFPGVQNWVYEEIEIPAPDGAAVPLSIIYDKTKFKKDGSNALLIDGYGAYGISKSPVFAAGVAPLLKRGMVYAVAHVRGGGEKGNAWHNAGLLSTKHNSWNDFNACTEYLIKNKYTSAGKVACEGGSAGGILIGRAITERPELYKVAIIKVGMLDVIRNEILPNSQGNYPEFGDVNDSSDFKAMLEMDPILHIKRNVHYPAQLIITGFEDVRVPSYIPAKFAATMQMANDPKVPSLLMVDFKSGHFSNSTVKEYAFLLWQTGHPDFQTKK